MAWFMGPVTWDEFLGMPVSDRIVTFNQIGELAETQTIGALPQSQRRNW